MAKRRTKADKINANHDYLISWSGVQSGKSEASVKRQSKSKTLTSSRNNSLEFYADNSEEASQIRLAKKNVLRSIGLFILILGIEIVLYYFQLEAK